MTTVRDDVWDAVWDAAAEALKDAVDQRVQGYVWFGVANIVRYDVCDSIREPIMRTIAPPVVILL